MQPVDFVMSLNTAAGVMGVSFLRAPLFAGEPIERVTALYIRATHGFVESVVMLPADAVRRSL